MARKARHKPHVRLYRHELECDAYRSLSTDARALLVEFRALYRGDENRIYMSVRGMQRRMGDVGQRRAQKARNELLERGFIRLLQQGSFSRKVRHAALYALTNEPLSNTDGSTAPKDFMSWTRKNTVAKTTTDGSQIEYRQHKKTPEKHRHGSQIEYRPALKPPTHGSQNSYTDKLPRSAELLMGAMVVKSEVQYKLILASLALMTDEKP